MSALPIVTCNDDFTTAATNVPRLALNRTRPLAILVQEAKRTPLHGRMPDGYHVRQYLRTQAMSGVAVAWDGTRARAIGTAKHDPDRIGHGIAVIVRPGRGDGILPRYVVWQDVEVGPRGSRRLVRLASYHRPPKRMDHLWREADRELAEWLARSPLPVILGTDSNTPLFHQLAKALGFKSARGVGIDCLMIRGRSLRFASYARRLARGSSDHHPVRVLVRIWRHRPH